MFTFTNCGVICVHRQCSRRAVLASTVTVWHCGHSSRAGTTILFYGELLYQQVARNCKLLSSARMTMDIGKLYNKYNFKQPGLPPGAACRDVAHVPVRQERRRVLFDHNDANSFNSVQNIIPLAPVLRGPATNGRTRRTRRTPPHAIFF